jgi:type IV pilus assembly protein PilQ
MAEPAPLPAEPAEPAPPASDAIDDTATDAPITASTPDPTPPLVPQARETRAGGKRISIDFTEADVRTVIELIASAGGYKVLFTPEVGGTVTISVVDRPWEDALATALRARRLREVRHEDVMLVSPAGR